MLLGVIFSLRLPAGLRPSVCSLGIFGRLLAGRASLEVPSTRKQVEGGDRSKPPHWVKLLASRASFRADPL